MKNLRMLGTLLCLLTTNLFAEGGERPTNGACGGTSLRFSCAPYVAEYFKKNYEAPAGYVIDQVRASPNSSLELNITFSLKNDEGSKICKGGSARVSALAGLTICSTQRDEVARRCTPRPNSRITRVVNPNFCGTPL